MFPFSIFPDIIHGAAYCFGAMIVYKFFNVIWGFLAGIVSWIKNKV